MILLPLEALPGWPTPTEFSTLYLWVLMILGPLAFGAVVTLLVFAPQLARKARGEEKQAGQELSARG